MYTAAGRVSKFVPASGAASRMFKTLFAALSETPPPQLDDLRRRADKADAVARDVVRFVDELDRFPFAPALRRELAALVPDYMLPRRVERLGSLPLNASGKIDRTVLARTVLGHTGR